MVKKNENSNSEIEEKRKEIGELKKELELKKEVFEMLKNGEEKKLIKNKLDGNSLVMSFYKNIYFEREKRGLITQKPGGIQISEDKIFYDLISSKLAFEKKQMEEKEIRLENLEYIKIQKENFAIQNRRTIALNLLTSILAFGVIIEVIKVLFIGDELRNVISLSILIIPSLFIFYYIIWNFLGRINFDASEIVIISIVVLFFSFGIIGLFF